MTNILSAASPLLVTNAVLAVATVDTLLTNSGERAALAKAAVLKIIDSRKFDKIIIADGSNHFLLTDKEQWLAARAGVKVEQIAFQQNASQVVLYGKGHGEMQILEFALKNSRFLQSYPSFYKLSGRYLLKNAHQVLKTSENYPDLFFNYNPRFCLPNSQFTCSAFYKCSIDTYERYLCHAIDYCNNSREGRLEAAFFNVLEKGLQLPVFSHFPNFEGVGGTLGKPIQNKFFLARNAYALCGGLAYTLRKGR